MEDSMDELVTTPSCKLKISTKLKKRPPLFVTNFTNSNQMNFSNASQLKFNSFKRDTDENTNISARRHLSANNGRISYSGEHNSASSPLQYFVGVRCKRTGKMKLFDAALFRMKPILKAVDVNNSNAATTPAKTYWEGINDLTDAFGSKTKKRALSTRIKADVQMSLAELNIDENISIRESPERSLIQPSSQDIDYLPPMNRNATLPRDVFNIYDIISPEEELALEKLAQQMIKTLNGTTGGWKPCSNFVKSHLVDLNEDKAKYLVYYEFLISFQNLKYNEIQKRDPIPSMQQPYKEHILTKFTILSKTVQGRETRKCPKQMKDKIAAYILVLALFIENFCVDLKDIVRDLSNMQLPKLATIAQALGCHVNKRIIEGEPTKVAELKVPLFKFTPKLVKAPK